MLKFTSATRAELISSLQVLPLQCVHLMTAIVQPPPLGSSRAKRLICECCFITLCTSALSFPVPMPCTMKIEEPLGLLAIASSIIDATSSARMPLMSLQPIKCSLSCAEWA